MKKIIALLLAVCMIAAFAGCAKSDTAATTEAAETTAATTEPAETTEATTEPTGPTEPKMLPGYADVYALNNDMVGWIKIEGTTLDNPVMQTPSNRDYYLNRSFDKEHNAHGSIYAWAEADINAPSDNITLFGQVCNLAVS